KWMDCFAKFPKLRLVGGLALRAKGFEIRMVFSGMGVNDVASCAKDAGFKTAVDGDGKFVSIEIPSMMMNVTQGYLALPDGSLDIDNGIRVDVTVQLKDSALADQAEQTFDTMKKMSDQLPADLRGVLDELKLDRKGDHLHVKAKITTEQMESLSKMGGMGGLG